jgi:hypothetical protein
MAYSCFAGFSSIKNCYAQNVVKILSMVTGLVICSEINAKIAVLKYPIDGRQIDSRDFKNDTERLARLALKSWKRITSKAKVRKLCMP